MAPTSATKTDITITLSRVEALALLKIAETGLAVTRALGLIPNTSTAEKAMRAVQAKLPGR